MAIVGFQQAPGYPPGAGMFQLDDGSMVFAHDPQSAAQFVAPPPPPRPGMPAGAVAYEDPVRGVSMPDDQAPPGAPQTATDAAPPNFSPAPAPQPVASGQPPTAQPPSSGAPSQPTMSPEDANRAQINGYLFGPSPGGARRAGYVPRAKSESVETTAPPVSPEYIRAWTNAQTDLQQAKADEARSASLNARAQSGMLEAQLPAIQARVSEARRQQLDAQRGVDADRAHLKQLMDDQANKKIDPNHFFSSKSVPAQIGIIIGQALGAYGATLGRGQNYAQEIINGMINRDIEAQKAAIESGQAGVNNQLKQLDLRYGDLNQATAALKAIQQQYVQTQMDAFAHGVKSDDVLQGYNTWSAQNRIDMLKTMRDFDIQSYGKHAANVSSQYQQATTGGATPQLIKQRAEAIKAAQEVGGVPGGQENQKLDLERQKLGIEQQKVEAQKGSVSRGQARFAANVVAGDNALHIIDDSLDKLGMKPGKDGEYETPGWLSRVGSRFGVGVAGMFGEQTARELQLNNHILGAEVAKIANGGAATDSEKKEMNDLLKAGDPLSLIQLRKMVKGFIRNNQNVGALARPGVDVTDVPGAEDYDGEGDGR